MSDIGLFPPGAMVWLCSLAWLCLCAVALLAFLFIAWLRTRNSSALLAHNRFAGYAAGMLMSGILAGASMLLIDWSGSLGAFSRWLDSPVMTVLWLAITMAIAPAVGFGWNRSHRFQNASA